jgi:hypothetical protein
MRDGSSVHCKPIDQLGTQLCPGSIATATPQTFSVASPPARQAGYELDHPTVVVHRTRPRSTRFELVPRLRSFTTGSSRIPSDLARRTRPVRRYQAVPALPALLPALPGVSRDGLRSAPTGLRQPGEEDTHLLGFSAPHAPQAHLVHEPPLTACVAGGAGGIDELGGEGPDPAVDRHVIDLDAALGQQLLDSAVGLAVAQLPPHGHGDHLTREPVASGRTRQG